MFVEGLEKGTLRAADDTLRVRPGVTTARRVGKKNLFNLTVSADVLQGPQTYMIKFSFLVTWTYFELVEKAFALKTLLSQERFSKLSEKHITPIGVICF